MKFKPITKTPVLTQCIVKWMICAFQDAVRFRQRSLIVCFGDSWILLGPKLAYHMCWYQTSFRLDLFFCALNRRRLPHICNNRVFILTEICSKHSRVGHVLCFHLLAQVLSVDAYMLRVSIFILSVWPTRTTQHCASQSLEAWGDCWVKVSLTLTVMF